MTDGLELIEVPTDEPIESRLILGVDADADGTGIWQVSLGRTYRHMFLSRVVDGQGEVIRYRIAGGGDAIAARLADMIRTGRVAEAGEVPA
jgi:hypothetical protein